MMKKLKIKKKGKIKIKLPAGPAVLLSCEELKDKFKELKQNNIDLENPEHIKLLKCMAQENKNDISNNDEFNFLYPSFDDPNFNYKIATKKEFNDNRYQVKSPEQFDNIEKISQMMCENTEFELEPHQMFVRNYLSFQTPYNGLLLYHGLGTGKTCSSISVCEEMRSYLKQLGITKRIIIVASPAVQENFKLQLFDARKLKEVNGLWNIKACTGNKFIKEINPMNMKGLTRDKVIRQIKRIISQSYHFQGYIEFSNYISRVMNKTVVSDDDDTTIKNKQRRALHREFSNRMIVIDEVHNLRITDDGKIKASSENILKLVSSTKNLKLLLLSATPMFNDYQEIVWLLNVLNLNDKRFPINLREVFDTKGNFMENADGEEIGKELLIQKMTGYVSYVRGNNPFTFPYAIYPYDANNGKSIKKMIEDGIWSYPSKQVNGKEIINPLDVLDLTITTIGDYQKRGYKHIIDSLKEKYPVLNNPNKGLSYTVLESPLQALNMIYPHVDLDSDDKDNDLYMYLYGKKGLDRVMLYNERSKSEFRYKDITLQNFGRIFSPNEIGKYSSKIAAICNSIRASKGIVFIYSQYIDGGGVPIALALEEMGIGRYGGRSLFKEPPTSPIDAITLSNVNVKNPAKYIMITGDKNLTPNVKTELKAITSKDNINGEKVKVVIVSRAGSEGLDFKNIRQTHILDPWYNLNRQEQIIGRSIRNLSHCNLPFEERNVEVFLYGTNLENEFEAADLYIYRLAENKAKKISTVTRLLKENAVDCLLNRKGQDFSEEIVNKIVTQKLSSGETIQYRIGDKQGSLLCDFTDCAYTCNTKTQDIEDVNTSTYNENFIIMNIEKILRRIRLLFKEYYIFDRKSLIAMIVQIKNYPLDQIYTALNYLVTEKNEYITDMLGRLGHLVNVGDYYMFQPVELGTKPITRFERVVPVDYKRSKIIYKLSEKIPELTFEEVEKETENQSVGINKTPSLTGEKLNKTIARKKKLVIKKKENASKLIEKMEILYAQLQNPGIIKTIDKEDWAKSAAWAIYNLEKYNSVDKKTLLNLAMHHEIDILNYKSKHALLSEIYFKENLSEVEAAIKTYFDNLTIESNGKTGIILADFNNTKYESSFKLLVYHEGKWISNKQMVAAMARDMFNKFQIRDMNIINDIVGFMTIFKGQQIVFKSKNMVLSDKGRTNKGQRCDRGEGKPVIIARINKLLGGGVKPIKYTMNKSTIVGIYGNDEIRQRVRLEDGKIKEVKIGSLQLCAESELIFRYYDSIRFEGKRWFFNTADALVNDIIKKGK